MSGVKSFLSPLWKTFYSGQFYRESASAGFVRALLFILFLSALFAALFSAKLHLAMVFSLQDELPFVIAQIPDIRIADGRLSVVQSGAADVKDPLYTIRSSDGSLLAVIDETAETAPEGLGGARVYVTGTDVAIADDEDNERSYSLSRIKDAAFDQRTYRAWAVRAWHFAGFALFPFLFIWFVACRALQVFLLACFAFIFFLAKKEKRSVPFCLSLAAYALVPPVVVGALMDLLTGTGFAGFLVTLLISAAIVGAVFWKTESVKEQ